MPGFRGLGFHMHSFIFGAGTDSPDLTVAASATRGGFGSTEGNKSFRDVTVAASQVLTLRGSPLYIARNLIMRSASQLNCKGTDAVGITGGGIVNGSFKLWGGCAGADGVANSAGTNGGGGDTIGAYNLGGGGGDGGDAPVNIGGVGGVDWTDSGVGAGVKSSFMTDFFTMYERYIRTVRPMEDALGGIFPGIRSLAGGAGGGAGGSDAGGAAPGAGGGGGGIIWIAADTIMFEENVVIDVRGGAGSAAAGAGDAGGGGGGGGGSIVLFYNDLILPAVNRPLLRIEGGAGGAGIGGGLVGVGGFNGSIALFNCSTGKVKYYSSDQTLTPTIGGY